MNEVKKLVKRYLVLKEEALLVQTKAMNGLKQVWVIQDVTC